MGVNFMEKAISIRNTEITFSVSGVPQRADIGRSDQQIWDLGGQREFVSMLPLVCNDAVAILFMFDLTRKTTLNSVKEWYRQARGFNKVSDLPCPMTLTDDSTDCDSRPDWHQIRRICRISQRGAGRDYKAGQAVLEGDARSPRRYHLYPPSIWNQQDAESTRSFARPHTPSMCRRSSRLYLQRPSSSR